MVTPLFWNQRTARIEVMIAQVPPITSLREPRPHGSVARRLTRRRPRPAGPRWSASRPRPPGARLASGSVCKQAGPSSIALAMRSASFNRCETAVKLAIVCACLGLFAPCLLGGLTGNARISPVARCPAHRGVSARSRANFFRCGRAQSIAPWNARFAR
jgi:hypothetical protein